MKRNYILEPEMKERIWKHHICFGEGDKINQSNKRFFLKFLVKENKNIKVLDLGCSDGELTKKIAESLGTNKIYGIDIDKAKAKEASKKGINVKISDLNYRFPFADNMFDVVTANQIIEHVWNTDNFFREVNRVLKKGGYAVISTPNLSSLHSIFFILLGQQPPIIHLIDRQVGNFLRGVIQKDMHYKAFNFSALKDLSNYYGFEVEKIEGFGFYFFPLFSQKILSKLFGRYAVFITVRIRKIKNLDKR